MPEFARAAHVVSRIGFPTDVARAVSRRLADEGEWVELEEGAGAFREGDSCSSLLIVNEGRVRVAKSAPSGRELLLYDLLPGEICVVTAACLLADLPYPARASAVEPTSGLVFRRRTFHDLVSTVPQFREAVFRTFATRLTEVMALVESVAFRTLDQRLASLLLQRTGRSGPDLRITHHQLANDLGCSREVVSRILEDFQERALVVQSRGRISVSDPAALAGFLAPPD